jgi:predicted nucleic acid-binding protein
MEVESGALIAGWGMARRTRLAALIGDTEVVWPGPELTQGCAALRAQCWRAGHALAQPEHNADLWIAATAVHLAVPLVSDDGIFEEVPGLQLEAP